jgi:hypothetical protein
MEYKNRLKALVWSIGMMILAVVIDWAIKNITMFNIPTEYTVLLGLVLAQISKYLNNEYQYRKELSELE